MSNQNEFDTIIVGSGAAGIYCLLRLSEHPINCGRTLVLDSGVRRNRRVISIKDDALVAELGAMRFMNHHVILRSLLKEFGVDTQSHAFPLHSLHLRGQRIVFHDGDEKIRGLSPRFDEVYLLDQDERGRSPDQLLILAMFRACKKILANMSKNKNCTNQERNHSHTEKESISKNRDSEISLRNWLEQLMKIGPEGPWPYLPPKLAEELRQTATLDGVPLSENTFWSIIQDEVSTECFHFIRDGLGYYTIVSEWNAAEALIRFINELGRQYGEHKSESLGYRSVTRGMGHLLNKMHARSVENFASEEILLDFKLKHFVTDIERVCNEITHFNVTAIERSDESKRLDLMPSANQSRSNVRNFTTSNLILCVTSQSLSSINFSGFNKIDFPYMGRRNLEVESQKSTFSEAIGYCTKAVSGFPLQKIILQFDNTKVNQKTFGKAWWNDKFKLNLGHKAKIISDTAVRQIYFEEFEQKSIIMLYVDGPPLEVWRSFAFDVSDVENGSETANKKNEKCYDVLGSTDVLRADKSSKWYGIAVSKRMYRHIRRLIARVLQIEPDGIPEPKSAVMRTWGDWPYTAGWHAWTAGSRSTTVRAWLARPIVRDENIFGFCGEAFSTSQGWMEGAFRSAELLLQSQSKDYLKKHDLIDEKYFSELGLGSIDDYIKY